VTPPNTTLTCVPTDKAFSDAGEQIDEQFSLDVLVPYSLVMETYPHDKHVYVQASNMDGTQRTLQVPPDVFTKLSHHVFHNIVQTFPDEVERICKQVPSGDAVALVARLRQQNDNIIRSQITLLWDRFKAISISELKDYPSGSGELLALFSDWDDAVKFAAIKPLEGLDEDKKKEMFASKIRHLLDVEASRLRTKNKDWLLSDLVEKANAKYEAAVLVASSSLAAPISGQVAMVRYDRHHNPNKKQRLDTDNRSNYRSGKGGKKGKGKGKGKGNRDNSRSWSGKYNDTSVGNVDGVWQWSPYHKRQVFLPNKQVSSTFASVSSDPHSDVRSADRNDTPLSTLPPATNQHGQSQPSAASSVSSSSSSSSSTTLDKDDVQAYADDEQNVNHEYEDEGEYTDGEVEGDY